MLEPRPCERLCKGPCGQWKHYSRFRSWRETSRHRSVSIQFKSLCRDCELIERNKQKNADRALWLMKKRASAHATALGVSTEFIWIEMNWQALVPFCRAMMTEEALCLDCGHKFLNERDIQIEHRDPPRFIGDWARENTRNIGLACASCNGTKSNTSYSEWLDRQEEARLANKADKAKRVLNNHSPSSLELLLVEGDRLNKVKNER